MSKVIAKSYQDHQGSQSQQFSQQLWTQNQQLSPKLCFKTEFLSPGTCLSLWINSRLRHNAFRKPGLQTSDFLIILQNDDLSFDFLIKMTKWLLYHFVTTLSESQGCKLSDFFVILFRFYSCVTMRRESSVHSACRVLYSACFKSSDKTYTMLLQGMCRRGIMRRRTRTSKAVGHPKSEITKSAIYQNLVTRPGDRGVKFSVNVSSAQQFLIAHTYKLRHTTFMCMKYKR